MTLQPGCRWLSPEQWAALHAVAGGQVRIWAQTPFPNHQHGWFQATGRKLEPLTAEHYEALRVAELVAVDTKHRPYTHVIVTEAGRALLDGAPR